MLKVFPIQSKDEQAELCARCDVPFDIDLLAYAVTVDDVAAGICQFKLQPTGGYIRHLAPIANAEMNRDAMFVLGRATLNFIDLCGIHLAHFDGNSEILGDRLLRMIGFQKNEREEWWVDLTDFFCSPCQHDHEMPENPS